MPYELRPYQKAAVKAVMHEWRDGNRKTLLVLPTGTGKTVVFANVAKLCVEHGRRVLILAHRLELLQQAAAKIREAAGLESSIEKAELTAVGSDSMVVIASMQTLAQEKRLRRYPPDYFQAVILDEAHHVLSESYQRIFAYFSGAFVLGVTATAERGDKKQLGSFFDSMAYEYSLKQAVEDGYLVPLEAQTIPLKLDISSVKVQNGDLQAGELGDVLEPYLEKIADEMAKVCAERKTVVFLPLIRISRKFTSLLHSRGFSAAEVNGTSADRAQILEDFNQGKYQVLCNSMLLTEGWDCPPVDCIVVLRPTQVRGLYMQMIGRGTRPFPGKEKLLILDFLWMSARHDICHPAVLTAGSKEVEEKMTEQMKNGEVMDLAEGASQTERNILEERRKALARQLKEMKDRQRKVLNPLEVGMMLEDADIWDYEPVFRYEVQPPTEKQLALLQKYGMDPSTVESKGQAQVLIRKLIERQDQKLCTLKQIRFLESRGFVNVYRWSFTDASEMMSRISANGWNVPAGIVPEEYIPEQLKGKRKKKRRIR